LKFPVRNHLARGLSDGVLPHIGDFILKAHTTVILGVIAALAAFSSAQAAEPSQEITITGTQVKTIPYDYASRRPVQRVDVTASVPVDLDVLTLNSGVALLEYNVRQAAERACMAGDPGETATADVTVDCIHRAVNDAQPQIDALVARARSQAKG
jgi:UrcA family protein